MDRIGFYRSSGSNPPRMPLAEPAPKAVLAEPIRLALDCLPDPSLVIGEDDAVVFANKAYERMTGFASREVERRALYKLTDSACLPGIALFRRKQGGFVPARIAVRPMTGDLAASFRIVRLDREETRRSAVEELTAGLDIRGEFLARVSHELRTPLTAMQEGIDVILDGLTGPLNAQQVEFLQLARRNVERLGRLVKDTLELGDLKRGNGIRAMAPANLDRLLQECAHAYPHTDYEPGPAVWAEIDEPRIRDVLERLIENAMRHSVTQIRLGLRCADGEATLAVADSGPGIPAAKIHTIFDEFEQLDLGPGRKVGGVGLGLPIVKLIVEQHGGRVWAESELGRGARFFFTLKTCPIPVEHHHDNRAPS